MAIDTESKEYQDGRERLYEHVREQHSEPLKDVERIPGAQESFARNIREGYDKNIEKAHKEGVGPYASPEYAAGAKEGVRDWEKQVREGERERHTERQRVW
jgi:hypothetical protein